MRNDFNQPLGDCITVLSLQSQMKVIQYARPASQSPGYHIRDLDLSPDGKFLVCGSMLEGGECYVFERNAEEGTLSYVAGLVLKDQEGRVCSPSCFVWV